VVWHGRSLRPDILCAQRGVVIAVLLLFDEGTDGQLDVRKDQQITTTKPGALLALT
jgi:hypothetical protein